MSASTPATDDDTLRSVALVTGGSRGIGASIVRRLAHDGMDVVFTYLTSAEAADALVAEYDDDVVTVEAIRADAASLDAMNALVGTVVDRFSRLDVLVNNAGTTETAPIDETSDDLFTETVSVNVRAPFILTREAARIMDEGGRIINVGSVWGERAPMPTIGLYALSKFAIAGLTRGVARDLGSRGITVNAIQPGPIDTDMNPADGELAQTLRPATALGRYGDPSEIADLVAFLAGPRSAYLTGAIINADGGYNA